jgi:hypothetical protein
LLHIDLIKEHLLWGQNDLTHRDLGIIRDG